MIMLVFRALQICIHHMTWQWNIEYILGTIVHLLFIFLHFRHFSPSYVSLRDKTQITSHVGPFIWAIDMLCACLCVNKKCWHFMKPSSDNAGQLCNTNIRIKIDMKRNISIVLVFWLRLILHCLCTWQTSTSACNSSLGSHVCYEVAALM